MDDSADVIVDRSVFHAMRAELGASFVRILGYFREDGGKAVAQIEEAMHRCDTAALVLPAHTMKSEARQFGADRLGALAEEIEFAARRGIEMGFFPDEVLPQVAELRPIYEQTLAVLDREINPLVARRGAFGRKTAA